MIHDLIVMTCKEEHIMYTMRVLSVRFLLYIFLLQLIWSTVFGEQLRRSLEENTQETYQDPIQNTGRDEWVSMELSYISDSAPGRLSFSWGERAEPKTMHRCSFVLKAALLDPQGKVIDKIVNVETEDGLSNSEKIILQYLKGIGAKVKRHSNRFIAAAAPVHIWERAFKTEFYHIHSSDGEHSLLRAKQYYLPKYIADHVHAVMNTVQIPTKIVKQQRKSKKEGSDI